ncbi:MAG TPA: type II secretion system minor pseudopilin GspK [Burkholderiales bacterium]|nr:type II secretion system minor pseudopilin GspK [Burkholderiales bacterium]
MRVPARAQRGVALITAVMIVAIAAAVAAKIAFAHQLWFRQMENVADRGATDLLRRGALHWASVALLEDAAQNSIDHLGEPWAQGLPTLPVDGGAIHVSVEDAQGRFNLNNLLQSSGQPSPADVAIFQRLLVELKLDPLLANALLDWIDPDSNVTSPGGAEDVDYLALKTPYRAANQPLTSIEELRLVRGFDAKTVLMLLPFVTVLPAGTHSAINVNTASPEVLAALTGMDPASAKRIADNRAATPMQNVADFTKQLPAGTAAVKSGVADVKTDFFLITLDTSIGRHQRRTLALLQRSAGSKSTNWIWHRPEPLIDAVSAQSSTGNDESTELR